LFLGGGRGDIGLLLCRIVFPLGIGGAWGVDG